MGGALSSRLVRFAAYFIQKQTVLPRFKVPTAYDELKNT